MTCRCPRPCFSITDKNDLGENSSGVSGTCHCSRLCVLSKTHHGCEGADLQVGNKTTSAGDMKGGSHETLRSCCCSTLCYMAPKRDGCTDEDPNLSKRNTSGSNIERNTSSNLGACRCSRICYMTPKRDGCTDENPDNGKKVISGTDLKDIANKIKRGSSLKASTSSSSGSCRCCKSKARKENTSASASPCHCLRVCNQSKHRISNIPENASLLSCRCSALCCKIAGRGGYIDSAPDTTSTTLQSTVDSSKSCDPGCRCGIIQVDSSKSCDPGCRCGITQIDSNKSCDPGCRCGITQEVPIKETKMSISRIGSCSCDKQMIFSEKSSAFSLDSTDLRYLEQIRQMTEKDEKLKRELTDLAAHEEAIRTTLKSCDQEPGALPTSGKPVDGGKTDNSNNYNNLRMLRAMNKELTSLNENLTDRIQDLHLEQDQLSQKINGPLTRELERIRKKAVVARCEASRRVHTEQIEIASDELGLVKEQLQRTQQNIADMGLVNEGIKQEVTVLQCKCDQMERVLIKQKVNEIDAINKIQSTNVVKSPSDQTSMVDKTRSIGSTPTCSCSNL